LKLLVLLVQSTVILAITLFNLATMGDISFNQILGLSYQPPDRIISYGDAEHHRIEYWQSESSGAAPLVILIHGGCWLNAYSVEHIRPLASKLQNQGYAVASIEYRRIGDNGGGWPGSFDDALQAINSTQALTNINPDEIYLMGHSAGGHLALWAASRFSNESPFANRLRVKIKRVVALAPISNLITYAAGNSSCERATPQLLGGLPKEQPQRYQLASPHLLRLNAPAILIHGAADPIVPIDQSREYTHTAKMAVLRTLPSLGHFDLIDPNGTAFQEILNALSASAR
jgi:acetyl esterase/lipase